MCIFVMERKIAAEMKYGTAKKQDSRWDALPSTKRCERNHQGERVWDVEKELPTRLVVTLRPDCSVTDATELLVPIKSEHRKIGKPSTNSDRDCCRPPWLTRPEQYAGNCMRWCIHLRAVPVLARDAFRWLRNTSSRPIDAPRIQKHIPSMRRKERYVDLSNP